MRLVYLAANIDIVTRPFARPDFNRHWHDLKDEEVLVCLVGFRKNLEDSND